MQFLNSLIADNRLVTLGAAIAAFLVFAVLILVFVRLLFGNRLRMSGARGRQQRLGVVDSYDMDRQRQLVLVRRDNTEHLIMIGGPNDVLIESAIVRVEARDGRERPALPREAPPAEAPSRLPMPDTWATASEAVPEPLAPPAPLPSAAARPMPAPQPAAAPPTPLPLNEPTPEPPAIEPVPTPDVTPEPEPPAKPVEPPVPPRQPTRPPIFARLRGRGEPTPRPEAPAEVPPSPTSIDAAPIAPPVSSSPSPPPTAEADFFETEIAKALAPSLRAKTPALPTEAVPTAPPLAANGLGATCPPLPPRPPLRPFPTRRDPLPPAAEGETGPTRPVRPAPPPFFSRMTQRPPERTEPPVESMTPQVETVAAPEPPPPPPPLVPESPEATPEPVASPPPPEVPSHAPPAGPIDPFEEEMARLLGRTTPKDN